MPREHHTSQQKTGLARTLLAVVFLILCAGNFAFWQFSFPNGKPNSTLPAMPGLVIGCILVSVVLIIAIWIRKPMARTALVVFTWIMMFVFSMPGLIIMSNRDTAQTGHLKMLAAGLVAYLLSNLILIAAGPIHQLGVKRGCHR